MTEQQAIELILNELKRAEAKFPDWPDDIIHAAAIVAEEAGELTRASLNVVYSGENPNELQLEAIQVGAMAIRFLKNLKLNQ